MLDDTHKETADETLRRIVEVYDLYIPTDHSPGWTERTGKALRALWAHGDRIENALKYSPGTHTFDDIARMVLSQSLTLWDLGDTMMLTEVMHFPQASHLHIFLAAGDLQTLLQTEDDLLDMARALGCSKVTLTGRQGWARELKKLGWHTEITTVAKEA